MSKCDPCEKWLMVLWLVFEKIQTECCDQIQSCQEKHCNVPPPGGEQSGCLSGISQCLKDMFSFLLMTCINSDYISVISNMLSWTVHDSITTCCLILSVISMTPDNYIVYMFSSNILLWHFVGKCLQKSMATYRIMKRRHLSFVFWPLWNQQKILNEMHCMSKTFTVLNGRSVKTQ